MKNISEFKLENLQKNIEKINIFEACIVCLNLFLFILFYFFIDFKNVVRIPLFLLFALIVFVIFTINFKWKKNTNRSNYIFRKNMIMIFLNIEFICVLGMIFFTANSFIRTDLYIMSVILCSAFLYLTASELFSIIILPQLFLVYWVVDKGYIDATYTIANTCFFIFLSFVMNRIVYRVRKNEYINEKELIERNEELKELSELDSLTGLANRRKLEIILNDEWKRSLRIGNTISLLLLDVDNFKKYNDYYGHVNGDECLKKVSRIIKNVTKRHTDKVCRFGGEEFIIVLPYTDINNAAILAEQIRREIEESYIPHIKSDVSDHVTVSIGVASAIANAHKTYKWLYEQVDLALYKAKNEGRNRIARYSSVERKSES